MKLNIDEIENDGEIYPRKNVSRKTVESYVESMKAGAEFPKPEVQRIKENGKTKTVILDGWHRIEAQRKFNTLKDTEPKQEIEVKQYKDEILKKEEHLNELRFVAIKRNLEHGDRISKKDKKTKCREIVKEDTDFKIEQSELADRFGVTQPTISNWVKDIRTKQKSGRRNLVTKLKLLGWTQQEIGKRIGLSQPTVSEIIKDIKSYFTNIPAYKEPGDKAELLEVDVPVAYGLELQGKSDLEKMREFGKTKYGTEDVSPFNYFKYPERDERLGVYEDGVKGQILMKLLYFFSEQGDLVINLTAKTGVLMDVCTVLGRRWRGYGKEPEIKTIIKHNIENGLPEEVSEANLVFLDLTNRFENMTKFKNSVKKLAKEIKRMANSNTKVAILTRDFYDENFNLQLTSFRSWEIFTENGFNDCEKCFCVIPDEFLDSDEVERCRKEMMKERKEKPALIINTEYLTIYELEGEK